MVARSPRICCLGDLISDVVVQLDRDPTRGTDTPAKISTSRGGSAANVSVAVTRAGGIGRFVGSVGDDPQGVSLVADLERNGVECAVSRVGATGTIVVLVDGTGERSFLTDRGAAVSLAVLPRTALDDVDLLHIPAYSFVEGPLAETAEQAVGIAVDKGIPISISTSSVAALRQYGRERFLGLLGAIRPEYVIANSVEYSYLMAGHPWIKEAAATVITNGGRAAVVRVPDGSEVRVIPDAAEVTDSTGAGDAFTGGFLVAQLRGEDHESSLRAGHEIAAKTLNQRGAQLR